MLPLLLPGTMILVVMLIMCCCVCSSSITTTTIILFLFFYYCIIIVLIMILFISLRINYEEDDSITAAASPTWNMGKEHYGTNNSLICNKNCI